jgi:hypothetical protein
MNDLSNKTLAERDRAAAAMDDATREPPVPVVDCLRRADDSDFSPPDDDDTGADRTKQAADRFGAAYEMMFEMAEMLVSRTGHLRQELVGFEFEGGSPMPARAMRVEQSDVLNRLMQQMLDRWPVVAHIFQGWSLPDASSAGYQHIRYEVIVIALHTRESACVATCRVDRADTHPVTDEDPRGCRSIKVEKGRLRAIPKDIGGRR